MELEQAKKRVEELRTVIEKNNRLYYDQDAPELEDFEYDALTRELKELEAQYPELVTPASPTQHVGGTPSGRFAKVTHAVKMESLLDAFSYDELRDFDRSVTRVSSRSMSSKSRSTVFLAALSTRTVNWSVLLPAATVSWARTSPPMSGLSKRYRRS